MTRLPLVISSARCGSIGMTTRSYFYLVPSLSSVFRLRSRIRIRRCIHSLANFAGKVYVPDQLTILVVSRLAIPSLRICTLRSGADELHVENYRL